MDERHWWIAGKIQECFRVGGTDNPSELESFIMEEGTYSTIGEFLKEGGTCRMFVYADSQAIQQSSNSSDYNASTILTVTDNIATLQNVARKGIKILYFLRNRLDRQVDPTKMQRDIFCGELKHNTLQLLTTMLHELYIPLIKSQKEWGKAGEENRNHLIQEVDKVYTILSDSASAVTTSKQKILKQPTHVVNQNLKVKRTAAQDSELIAEYENLVTAWVSTINNIIEDTTEERFMDVKSGPLSELDRWRRRQRLINNIMDQLKGAECKAVISFLITVKSKLLKSWRTIDVALTDAMNEAKDKVKFLEALKRHLEPLYSDATPLTMVNTIIPNVMTAIKQMESVSRFYARSGYLGYFLTKVLNQIVLCCIKYINRSIDLSGDGGRSLWDCVDHEIRMNQMHHHDDPQQKQIKMAVEAILTVKSGHGGKNKDVCLKDYSLMGRLKACQYIQSYFRDTMRTLREFFGFSQAMSHFTSLSSFAGSITSKTRTLNTGGGRGPTSMGKRWQESGHGVSLSDEEAIMGHIDTFCGRLKRFMDVIHTLSQYHKLQKTTSGMPRPRKMDVDNYREETDTCAVEQIDHANSPLTPITEDGMADQDGGVMAITEMADEELMNADKKLSEEQLAALDSYSILLDEADDECASISWVIKEKLESIQTLMQSIDTTEVISINIKEGDTFETMYTEFLSIISKLELFIEAYIQGVFLRNMRTHEALDIVARLNPIHNRADIKTLVADKYVECFHLYESDLDDALKNYEEEKDCQSIVRNAPPVAGAIQWARQLLKRIEQPMEVFRDVRAVTSLADFPRAVKLYNRLATTLVTFESLWFNKWKEGIEHATLGLRATLLVRDPTTGRVVVNMDDRMRRLIHEAKWFTRMGIKIPAAATSLMDQEMRFKTYKNHLELVLARYYAVCNRIPLELKDLFLPFTELVDDELRYGLQTLAWNSMNIDAFLYQVHTATSKLEKRQEKVSAILTDQVHSTIEKISTIILYDHDVATSTVWKPAEFCDGVSATINDKVSLLNDYIDTIVKGLESLTACLTIKKEPDLTSLQALFSRRKKELEKKAKRLTTTEVYRGARMKEKTSLYLDDDDRERDQLRKIKEDENIQNIIDYYGDKVYSAVLTATRESLSKLFQSCCSASSNDHDADDIRIVVPVNASGATEMSYTDRCNPHISTDTLARGVGKNTSFLPDSKDGSTNCLQFKVRVKLVIPCVEIEPPISSIQTAITTLSKTILFSCRDITWPGVESTYHNIPADDEIVALVNNISNVMADVGPQVQTKLFFFSIYDFLWKDDLHGNYDEFIASHPTMNQIRSEVERLLGIENQILDIPASLQIGPVCLQTYPIKDTLQEFTVAWKEKYASILHSDVKHLLVSCVNYRTDVVKRLEKTVTTLDQLNTALHLLEELSDMENKVDDIYLPIETMYAKLRDFQLWLPVAEIEAVDSLRDEWQKVLTLADHVRTELLIEGRGAFEQELDKQVKSFVVEVIQFRNAFDGQGPAVPGIRPEEAVLRLEDFQKRFDDFNAKRKTLDSVSKLFSIPCKPFPELDKTGEELELLSQLYGLFQKFIVFDTTVRDTLWAEVDLAQFFREVEGYWDECLALPSKLKDWDAYQDLNGSMQAYLKVFPLLERLASKEIRNRHWLQVMSLTGSSFQLEANVFKLCHLLNINLINYKKGIEDICLGASRELELEVKMRLTEDEWTEQVLIFEHYKNRGPIFLTKSCTISLLEQLDDARALLAHMLTSQYIGPLRDEAANWAEKLKEVAMVLDLWLDVQDLWQNLEAVFSNTVTTKDLPQEAKRFQTIDRTWTKMMKRAFETRNVLQCCHGSELPKGVVIRHIQEELETCFKSLTIYLDNKRRAFPRFYLVSDMTLMSILSRPNDFDSVRPHIRSLFTALTDVDLQKLPTDDQDNSPRPITPLEAGRGSQISRLSPDSSQQTKIDKRLTQIFNLNSSVASQHVYLPSEMNREDVTHVSIITDVRSEFSDRMALSEPVRITHGVDSWLARLQKAVGTTLHDLAAKILEDFNNGIPMEAWALQYPSQICRLGMMYHWTTECEQSIVEQKNERRALHVATKKYTMNINRLSMLLTKGMLRGQSKPLEKHHKIRLENMLSMASGLRDGMDSLGSRKLKELSDFEWRRCIKLYFHKVEEKPTPFLYLLDSGYRYGTEFYGSQMGVAVSPTSERMFLSILHCLQRHNGVLLTGPPGVGRTTTLRGLANLLGVYLAVFQCVPNVAASALSRYLVGVAMEGCWSCVNDGHNLSKECMSVLLDYTHTILTAVKTGSTHSMLGDGQEIAVKSSVCLSLIVNAPNGLPNDKLNPDIMSLYRQISLIKPDMMFALKTKCNVLGFKAASMLATRLKIMRDLVHDQLSPQCQHHFSLPMYFGALQLAIKKKKFLRDERLLDKLERKEDNSRSNSQMSEAQKSGAPPSAFAGKGGTRKMTSPSLLSSSGRIEHSLVQQALEEIVIPRLEVADATLFKCILRDTFFGLPDPPNHTSCTARTQHITALEHTLEQVAELRHLIPHKPWIDKCVQLHIISDIYNGMIITGPPSSGKTSCIQTFIESLNFGQRQRSSSGNKSRGSTKTNKILRLNPMVVENPELIFGSIGSLNEFIDGIVTSAFRKASRSQCTTWLCMDGPLIPSWADHFNSILSKDRCLKLINGDELRMGSNMKVMFETDSLSESSPTTIANAGIVYLGMDVVGWRPLAKAWLQTRTHHEEHVLNRAFNKMVDPIITFVMEEAKLRIKLPVVSLFKTMINFLSAMLTEEQEINGEMHIERMFLFCMIWSFGGLLEPSDRQSFSDLVSTLTTSLPDDDQDICVFDYYVDETGEWDPWHSIVPDTVQTDPGNSLGDVLIETVDTIRTRTLMNLAVARGLNVMLVGPHGAGKTFLTNSFIANQDQQKRVSRKLVFSGSSTASQLQSFIEANIYHRQGFVYGAKENKKLQIFIDDLSMAAREDGGISCCLKLLRQILDAKSLHGLEKPFEFKNIEDLSMLSAMTVNDAGAIDTKCISDRLLQHFAVLWLPAAEGDTLKTIMYGLFEWHMMQKEYGNFELELHNAIVAASCKILKATTDVLRPTYMPGRHHYIFSLATFSKLFQCMRRLPDESWAEEELVISLWKHEVQRMISDTIAVTSDALWFEHKLSEVTKEVWPEFTIPDRTFVTFSTDPRSYQRPVTAHGTRTMKVVLQPITNLQSVYAALLTNLNRHNDEFGNVFLDISLSDHIITQIIRLHRILGFHQGGNCLLVGAVGAHLSTLCRLALHVADIPIHKIDSSKHTSFFDGLRSAIRVTGTEDRLVTLLFTARDLDDVLHLDALNSILVSGEYAHLFSNDELDGLLQAIISHLKRDQPTAVSDPMKFFIARVLSNLHVIICLPPTHELLRTAAYKYPGLIRGCQVMWINDWTQDALLGDATFFINKNKLNEPLLFNNLEKNVASCLANIHSFILQDCKQIPWAGDTSTNIAFTNFAVAEKKRDNFKVSQVNVPNWPYSKSITMDNIKLRHYDSVGGPAKNEVFVGPMTYHRFIHCFHILFKCMVQKQSAVVDKLGKVIAILEQTQSDATVIKMAIKYTTNKFDEAKRNTSELFDTLNKRVMELERLKARVGLSTSLDAYLHLTECEADDEDSEELLHHDEYDKYDTEFDEMRKANLQTRHIQVREELEQIREKISGLTASIHRAREHVIKWTSKVDRSVVENIKNFAKPPVLVYQIIEMVMIMIGKRMPTQRFMEKQDTYNKDDMSSRMSSSSSSTRIASNKKVRSPNRESERYDRKAWKSMQLTMNDTIKYVEMLHNIPWVEGLNNDVYQAVDAYLDPSARNFMLSQIDEAEHQSLSEKSASPECRQGITVSAARYASEDCYTLVLYVLAILEYTSRLRPLRAARDRMAELEREIEESERLKHEEETMSVSLTPEPTEEVDYTEADLPVIQQEVEKLQESFDMSVMEKHSLESELKSMQERLKAATNLLDSLKGMEQKWQTELEDNRSSDLLLANCITAAAFLTYCCSMDIDLRQRMGQFFMQVCEHHNLPLPKQVLFHNMELHEFLYDELDMVNLSIHHLPITRLMLENSCLLRQTDTLLSWPLICDPTNHVVDWLRLYFGEDRLVVAKYHEMKSQLENCLIDGHMLLVIDTDVVALQSDSHFKQTIHKCRKLVTATAPFKVIVGDHEVEVNPKFRLLMHTSSLPHKVPPHLAAYTNVILFQLSRPCLEEALLDRFMRHEKKRLDDERKGLTLEKKETMATLLKIEGQIQDELCGDCRLIYDLSHTKKLMDLMKHYEETEESLSRISANDTLILKARSSYKDIARQAAVCFDVAQYLREINALYQTSYQQFLDIFDTAICHSDRVSMKAVVDRLTHVHYISIARMLKDRDRFLHSLLLAIEVEASHNRIGVGEREFFISPAYSSMVVSSVTKRCSSPINRVMSTKKSFDWMHDDQFNNLQILAMYFDWFYDMFERMPRDGRETQWRALCESDTPEKQPLPDKMDDVYHPMQRLMVLRAVRSDRIMQEASLFITSVLGKKYISDVAIDLPQMVRQSRPSTPIILQFVSENTMAKKLFLDFAARRNMRTLIVAFSEDNHTTERYAKKIIAKGMAEGMWVLLHNAHNAPHLLLCLDTILQETHPHPDNNFRCWVSTHADSTTVPVRLLQIGIRTLVESPKMIKENMQRTFAMMDAEIFAESNRSEWPAILHNICYLHSLLRLRHRYGVVGWNEPEAFQRINAADLQDAISFLSGEFRDTIISKSADNVDVTRATSWSGIRYMLNEVIYGSKVTHPQDRLTLQAIVEYWMNILATRREFEIAKVKYRLPNTFFHQNVRLHLLIQSLDTIPQYQLEAPEACHIHSNNDTVLGEEQYTLTRINKIYDTMPSSKSLSHNLFTRPPTPFKGVPQVEISVNSNMPNVCQMGIFCTACSALMKMKKETELWEICHMMLPKVPKSCLKEYINDRVKKTGGHTIFNLFIMRELDLMNDLLQNIRTTLTTIKQAMEIDMLGDQLTNEMLSCADDLYYQHIPKLWRKMAGDSAPPYNIGLGQWMMELGSRCQHYERILLLGREKMPAYWLGAFFNPRALLSMMRQEYIRQFSVERSGQFEQYTFSTEVTARDKDHLRDPPQEGMFIYGLYLWGCAWDKTSGDLQDTPPKGGYSTMPVVHITCCPMHDRPSMQDSGRASEIFNCPVYASRYVSPRHVLFEMDMRRENVLGTRWALRGLCGTIRPY